MVSFDQSLMDLLSQDLIDYDEALRLSTNPEDFQLRAAGVASGQQWHDNSDLNKRVRGDLNQDGLEIEMLNDNGTGDDE